MGLLVSCTRHFSWEPLDIYLSCKSVSDKQITKAIVALTSFDQADCKQDLIGGRSISPVATSDFTQSEQKMDYQVSWNSSTFGLLLIKFALLGGGSRC